MRCAGTIPLVNAAYHPRIVQVAVDYDTPIIFFHIQRWTVLFVQQINQLFYHFLNVTCGNIFRYVCCQPPCQFFIFFTKPFSLIRSIFSIIICITRPESQSFFEKINIPKRTVLVTACASKECHVLSGALLFFQSLTS